MIKPNDILLNAKQIFNSVDETAILLNVREGAEYVDGVKTEKISHYKYEIVLPQNQFEKITVKIPGPALITNEQITQKGGIGFKVKFKNLTAKFYRKSNGEYALSASADGLEVIA